MTCYKLVSVEFKWLGIQGKVESVIQNVRPMFLDLLYFHR
jgi:hypothetical protein